MMTFRRAPETTLSYVALNIIIKYGTWLSCPSGNHIYCFMNDTTLERYSTVRPLFVFIRLWEEVELNTFGNV